MVRTQSAFAPATARSPHPRGDGPSGGENRRSSPAFSPPAWGWSVMKRGGINQSAVLPTRVGMVRTWPAVIVSPASSPHPRGDGPQGNPPSEIKTKFSPPAWGWSAHARLGAPHVIVLPTRVGMVRGSPLCHRRRASSPHPRGDGPSSNFFSSSARMFSPPAWGWSDLAERAGVHRAVLPTRVGMVRASHRVSHALQGSPHPRGDGPPASSF